LHIESRESGLIVNMASNETHSPSRTPRTQRGRGFTLLELMMAMVVVGLLSAIALPSYTRIAERQRILTCESDLRKIAINIERFRLQNIDPPMSLAELGMALPKDPWGRDYQFLNFDAPIKGIKGLIRKDHNLHPLNSDFDLYSLGKDGRSSASLTAKASRDDVIWAGDGAFVGLASDY
jgi:general secretion pathway protein G